MTDYLNIIKQDNLIIGEDINAKYQSWGCRANNSRGLVIYNFVSNNNYKILLHLDQHVTKIPNIIQNIENLLDINFDHTLIELNLNDYPPPTRSRTPKLFYSHTNKLLFHNLV